MKKIYFAFGMNLNKEGMTRRCPDSKPYKPLILKDWELKFHTHATIVPSPGNSVSGMLWEITSECERRLDILEGFPDYYTKKTWQQDGIEFFFYEMTPRYLKNYPPTDGYVECIREGYAEWKLPTGCLETALKGIECPQ